MKTLTECLPDQYRFTLTTLDVDGREMSQKTSPWAWISWKSDPVATWSNLNSSFSPASFQDSKYIGNYAAYTDLLLNCNMVITAKGLLDFHIMYETHSMKRKSSKKKGNWIPISKHRGSICRRLLDNRYQIFMGFTVVLTPPVFLSSLSRVCALLAVSLSPCPAPSPFYSREECGSASPSISQPRRHSLKLRAPLGQGLFCHLSPQIKSN
nr:uncharacterized protein LOC105870563 [Microcebus murinus]